MNAILDLGVYTFEFRVFIDILLAQMVVRGFETVMLIMSIVNFKTILNYESCTVLKKYKRKNENN